MDPVTCLDPRMEFVEPASPFRRTMRSDPGTPHRIVHAGRRCRSVARHRTGGNVLFIEYDVTPEGSIELVALINAVEENGADPHGEDWMTWRVEAFEDDGLGCVGVPPSELALMERTDDADGLRAIVERVILADRAAKERSDS